MDPRMSLRMKDCLKSPEGKLQFNEAHFTEASSRYDFATRAMSLGRDARWKDELVALLPDRQRPVCLDLACGTGDLTFRLADRYPEGSVIGLDLTEAMIARARTRSRHENVEFLISDMCHTGLDDNSIDIVSGGYALRNAPDILQALAEIDRVMKPGATAAFLDFSKPTNRHAQTLNYLLLKGWGRFWGWTLHRNGEIHGYIAESLKTYPDREELNERIRQVGFLNLRHQRYFLGIMEIIAFDKPD